MFFVSGVGCDDQGRIAPKNRKRVQNEIAAVLKYDPNLHAGIESYSMFSSFLPFPFFWRGLCYHVLLGCFSYSGQYGK